MNSVIGLVKEVLRLNAAFVVANIAWGFILAYIATNKAVQIDVTCVKLQALAIFGLVIGTLASFADSALEVFQDAAYTGQCCSKSEILKATMDVKPDDFGGVTWNTGCCGAWGCCPYGEEPPDAGYDATNTHDKDCSCFLLSIETVFRLAGNVSLFWFFVLGTSNPAQWQTINPPKLYPCNDTLVEPLSWFYENALELYNPFLISVLALNAFRVYWMSYRKKKAPTKPTDRELLEVEVELLTGLVGNTHNYATNQIIGPNPPPAGSAMPRNDAVQKLIEKSGTWSNVWWKAPYQNPGVTAAPAAGNLQHPPAPN